MVSVGTNLLVTDNSGALKVRCFTILGSSFCNNANIGDTLVGSVKSALVGRKVSKHTVQRCILVRQRRRLVRKNGITFYFLRNSVVLIKPNRDPIGNRVHGSVLQELRFRKCLKIMLLAFNIL